MTTPRCSIAHCNEPGVLCFLVRTRAARHSDDTPTAGYAWACVGHGDSPASTWTEVTRVRDDDGQPKAGRGL